MFLSKIDLKFWVILIDDYFDTKGQYYQHFTRSFYAYRSQKQKNTVKASVFFARLDMCE